MTSHYNTENVLFTVICKTKEGFKKGCDSNFEVK